MKIKPILLILLLSLPFAAFAQKRKSNKAAVKSAVRVAPKTAVKSTARFYLEIYRPDCCQLAAGEWERIARKLQAKQIPAFFGSRRILDYREAWHPVELKKTTIAEGSLILGPFASGAAAEKALAKLPNLLPRMGDDFRGVEAGATGEAQTWRIGMYQISGLKTIR